MLRPVLLALVLFPTVAFSQVYEPRPLVVMNLAAHPDDEDGNTLAYYRHHENAVAYSVIYTRGEGGQNEAGPELYERLGAIRTAETEAAARILGTQVFFLNFYDFGYSKTADETFAEWSRDRRGFWDTGDPVVGVEEGRDRVTARLVYLIRKLKPDVIFTNHDTLTVGPNTQHGHHQVVGQTAYDAFALASDGSFHPEQLQEDGVDLWQPKRLFLRQWRNPDGPDVAVPVGDPCPNRLLQAVEDCTDIAVRAAGQHFSQGFDRFAPRFRADTTYFRLLRSAERAEALPAGAEDLAVKLELSPRSNPLPLDYRVASGRAQAHSLMSAPHPPPVVVRGAGAPEDWPLTLPAHVAQYDRMTTVPSAFYQTSDEGFLRFPSEIAPPTIIDLPPSPIRLVPGENQISVEIATYDPAATVVEVRLKIIPEGGMTQAAHRSNLTLMPDDTKAIFKFDLSEDIQPGRYRIEIGAMATPTSAPAAPYIATRPAAVLPDVSAADGLRVGFVRSYDDVTENALRAMGADVTALDSMALAAGDLSQFDTIVLDIRAYLVRADLRQHNQRLLGWVRQGGHLVVGYHKTFEWNPGQSGGFFDMDVVEVPENGWAPYPLRLGRNRVTREDAPIEVLRPDHVLFQAPHEIVLEDWNDWVQERGLYFPGDYDERYAELLSMNDPGEDPLPGSLLLTNYGEGTYLYSSLGWYRQLEALNPGAWRMFANLVSLPLTDGR